MSEDKKLDATFGIEFGARLVVHVTEEKTSLDANAHVDIIHNEVMTGLTFLAGKAVKAMQNAGSEIISYSKDHDIYGNAVQGVKGVGAAVKDTVSKANLANSIITFRKPESCKVLDDELEIGTTFYHHDGTPFLNLDGTPMLQHDGDVYQPLHIEVEAPEVE